MIIENNGLKVDNGQVVKLKAKPGHKYEYWLYNDNLFYASGPEIELLATATDAEGNSYTASDVLSEDQHHHSTYTASEELASSELPDFLLENSEPTIYPVPSYSSFNIRVLLNEGVDDFRSFGSMNAGMLIDTKIGDGSLQEGIYLILVQAGGINYSRKVIKTR
jgi:hypothetical protein